MKRVLSIVLALNIALSLTGCIPKKAEQVLATIPPTAATTIPTTEATFPPEDVIVLYTNDIHTYIEGPMSYHVLAALKEELEWELGTGNVILADAGDIIQGTSYGYMDNGLTMIKLMNAAKYDVATLGNHEFDYGMDSTMWIISDANFPFLCCNFYHEKDGIPGEPVLASSKLFEAPGGLNVGFVGVTTPESFVKASPEYFQDKNGNYIYGIAGGEDGSALADSVQKAIDELEGADVIIGLSHLGIDEISQPWTSREVISKVSGLDAFIDGNSHTVMEGEEVLDKDGKPVILTQTGRHFGSIGMMVIDRDTKAITTDLIECVEVTEVVLDESGSPVLDSSGKEKTEVVGYAFASDLLRTVTDVDWCESEEVKAIQDSWIHEIWIAENMEF